MEIICRHCLSLHQHKHHEIQVLKFLTCLVSQGPCFNSWLSWRIHIILSHLRYQPYRCRKKELLWACCHLELWKDEGWRLYAPCTCSRQSSVPCERIPHLVTRASRWGLRYGKLKRSWNGSLIAKSAKSKSSKTLDFSGGSFVVIVSSGKGKNQCD